MRRRSWRKRQAAKWCNSAGKRPGEARDEGVPCFEEVARRVNDENRPTGISSMMDRCVKRFHHSVGLNTQGITDQKTG